MPSRTPRSGSGVAESRSSPTPGDDACRLAVRVDFEALGHHPLEIPSGSGEDVGQPVGNLLVGQDTIVVLAVSAATLAGREDVERLIRRRGGLLESLRISDRDLRI